MGKFFTCACARCSSATELGTYSSALLCPAPGCRAPVVTAEPADTRSDWRCTAAGCGKLFPVAKVSNVTGAIKAQAERLEYSEQRAEDCGVAAHEAFLKKYGSVLHPNHVILIRAKYSLAKMYGRMAGYEAASLGPDLLDRKRQLCEEVLGVLDTLMPGQVSSHWPPWSRDPVLTPDWLQARMRGVMLYELHLPLVLAANRQLQLGPGGGADPEKIKANLRRGLQCLKQGLDILRLQPEDSFEAKIVAGAKGSLVELENWVKTITEAL